MYSFPYGVYISKSSFLFVLGDFFNCCSCVFAHFLPFAFNKRFKQTACPRGCLKIDFLSLFFTALHYAKGPELRLELPHPASSRVELRIRNEFQTLK